MTRFEILFTKFIKYIEAVAKENPKTKKVLEYYNYILEKKTLIDIYLNDLNKNNSMLLASTMTGVSRYFDEFNWFSNQQFYEKVDDYLNELCKLSDDLRHDYAMKD
jgi:hypothetical protein